MARKSALSLCLLITANWSCSTDAVSNHPTPIEPSKSAAPLQHAAMPLGISRLPAWARIALGLNALGLSVWLPRRVRRRKHPAKENMRSFGRAEKQATCSKPAPIDLQAWLKEGATGDCKEAELAFLQRLHALLTSQVHSQALNVFRMASALCLSRRQIERRMRRLFHITPKQMLIQARLLQSTQLLRAGESVKKTALTLGFHSPENFSRFFRNRMAMSPAVYRAHMNQAHSETTPEATRGTPNRSTHRSLSARKT